MLTQKMAATKVAILIKWVNNLFYRINVNPLLGIILFKRM